MRNAFANQVTALAERDPRVLLLSGDIGNRLFDPFKAKCPGRFFNCGVAEANMIGVAAGLALNGFRPIVYTITPFITARCFEQLRIDVAYHEAPVIIVGTGSGLSYASLGPTHHSLEDLALLRTLPGMRVIAPSDANELQACLAAALEQNHPVYFRIGKKGEPVLTPPTTSIQLGMGRLCRPGTDLLLLTTGTILKEALDAATILQNQDIDVEVVHLHTVKPLDHDYLLSAASRFSLWVTLEEHGQIGGMGSAIAEWRAHHHVQGHHLLLGTPDQFCHVIGSQDYLRTLYHLNGSSIVQAIRNMLCASV